MIADINLRLQHNNYSFICIYKICDGHATVLRQYGTSQIAVVPDKIDGRPVTELDAYCFASSNRLTGEFLKESDILSDRLKYFELQGYHELCGEFVTEVILPDCLKSVGNYSFYNCRNLKKITLGARLEHVGSDAFMNCNRLNSIAINSYATQPTGLRYLLSQLNQGVNVDFADGTFYYPEYTESYEEIGPAHIFALNLEGEGYRARQCFNDGVIDIARYDDVFEKASAMENAATLFRMAIGRLGRPIALKTEYKERYTAYIKQNARQILDIVVESKDRNSLDFLCLSKILDVTDYMYGQKKCVESGWTYGSSRILTMNDNHDNDGTEYKNESRRHVQTESEWQEDVGVRITQYVRGELYLDLRFMESSLYALTPVMNNNVYVYAADGMHIYFNADKLCNLLKNNVRFLQRVYLHSVLHCVYLHLWTRNGRNAELWGLACDINVEHIIDSIDKPSTRRIISWTRQDVYDKMNKMGIVSAAQIYNWLVKQSESAIHRLMEEFHTDDHIFWENKDDGNTPVQTLPDNLQKQWEDMARQDELRRRSMSGDGENDEEIFAGIRRSRNRYSYREFLQKFTQIREEMKINPDEFDLSYYSYGLSVYGNIPLIEPLETRESRKIYEFVIVLDTSYSTSGELVEKFLYETLNMLTTDNAFFEKIRLHIIQCDDKVTRDITVENSSDIDGIFENFIIKGGGNTDFRPAFNYVNDMVEQGRFNHLGGMIYFTDGRGIYPMKKPSYKTAFVYFKEIDLDTAPSWVVTYQLQET